tara:strand:- start:141 stop:1088 length:948 start_codon:yes stop_codon:yes gene_type:complete
MTQITDKSTYLRRRLLTGGAALGLLTGFPLLRYGNHLFKQDSNAVDQNNIQKNFLESDGVRITDKFAATHHNNAYEFGWRKTDPYQRSGDFNLRPWGVTFDGLCEKPRFIDLDDLMGGPFDQLEERIYRLRCVEAWSMVIPYNGRPLGEILRLVKPLSTARYVSFTCLLRPEEMPGQSSNFSNINWPYVESLTIEEAMHPLTLATFGVYGDFNLPQNGMPFRVTVPWKYGFKSPKFVVKISFSEERPPATWNLINSKEYGWYSNVYPDISHPRWSQKTERRIWANGVIDHMPTEIYNGYAEHVAHLYPNDNILYR